MRTRVAQNEGTGGLKQSRGWCAGGAAGSQSGYREMSKQKAANRRLGESRSFREEVWILF